MRKEDPGVSAQVMLRAASGKTVRGDTIITSANLAEYAPAPETSAQAQRAFAGLGFEVGNLVGNSFSISGSASLFERAFGVTIEDRAGGGFQFSGRGSSGLELPREALPAEVAPHVAAVTFTPPPDFGPTNFM